MKRLLVTGATGFIGAHCLRRALASGYDEIHAVARDRKGPAATNLTWHVADLRDSHMAARLIETVRPTHLFHAAWVAKPVVYLTSPENIDWLQATVAMVRAFAERGGQRVVGLGSSAEYGHTDGPCKEDKTPIVPRSVYGCAKAATWQAIAAIAEAKGLEAAWGRLFLVYGSGDPAQRLIPATAAKIRAGEKIVVPCGEQKHDFVYAPDAAEMLVGLLDSNATGVFNIGSGRARSVRSVVEAVAACLCASDPALFCPAPPNAPEPPMHVADMRKLDSLGLYVRTPMEQVLHDLVAPPSERKPG